MKRNSIGLIELSSIAAGYMVTDAMLKAAGSELLLARSICSGKYMTMVRGEVAEVTASVEAGCEMGRGFIVDTFIIPNLHDSIFPAIYGSNKFDRLESLGILESFSVASLIEAADASVKAADVQLLEIRLAMALGGKAFVTMSGAVSAVQAAVEAGAQVLGRKGLLVCKVVIPAPRKELLTEMV